MRLKNAQQALPMLDHRLPCAAEIFKRLLVRRLGAQSAQGVARRRPGADDLAHQTVEHLNGRSSELFFKGLETRMFPRRSFTHT